MRVCLELDLFRNQSDMGWSEEILNRLLRVLLKANREYIRRHRPPGLYASGVRYKAEPRGRENWKNIGHVIEAGFGDCEDLASWRLAELKEQGETDARYVVKRQVRNGFVLYHILLRRGRRGGFRLEDPSRRLGMGS